MLCCSFCRHCRGALHRTHCLISVQVFNPKDLEGLRERLEKRKADGTLKDLEEL